MTTPTTPLTVIQDVTDPEWQRLITRFWSRRCDHCRTLLPADAMPNQRYCGSACAKRASRARMMTAVRKLDSREDAA